MCDGCESYTRWPLLQWFPENVNISRVTSHNQVNSQGRFLEGICKTIPGRASLENVRKGGSLRKKQLGGWRKRNRDCTGSARRLRLAKAVSACRRFRGGERVGGTYFPKCGGQTGSDREVGLTVGRIAGRPKASEGKGGEKEKIGPLCHLRCPYVSSARAKNLLREETAGPSKVAQLNLMNGNNPAFTSIAGMKGSFASIVQTSRT